MSKVSKVKIKKWQDLVGKTFVDKCEIEEGPKMILQLFKDVSQHGESKGSITWNFVTFAPQFGISWMRMGGPEKEFIASFLDGHEIVAGPQYAIKKINKGPTRCWEHGTKIDVIGNFIKGEYPCPDCKREVIKFRRWHAKISKKSK